MRWIFFALCILWAASASAECRNHIQLLSAARIAEEYGATEAWIVSNHKVNLWQKPSHLGKGQPVGKLLPGSRAVIVDESGSDYRVKSPIDGSTGWVNVVQVERTLWQDDRTFQPCRQK